MRSGRGGLGPALLGEGLAPDGGALSSCPGLLLQVDKQTAHPQVGSWRGSLEGPLEDTGPEAVASEVSYS